MNRRDERRTVTQEHDVSTKQTEAPEAHIHDKGTEPVTERELRSYTRPESREMAAERTWKPPTAGILEILAGAANFLAGLGTLIGGTFIDDLFSGTASYFASVTGQILGSVLMVLGIISIIGGIMCLRRQRWGMGIAGAITALFPAPAFLLGILALIFVTISRDEFHNTMGEKV